MAKSKLTDKGHSTKFFISKNDHLLFDKTNYFLIVLGGIFIIVGFILMAGGGSNDPNVFDADEIYSARRITIAPIVVIIGFIIETFAIMKKPAQS